MKFTNFAAKSRFLAVLVALVSLGGLFLMQNAEFGGRLFTMRFNPYALLSLMTYVLLMALLLYFLRKPARTDERIWLGIYLAAISLFAGSEAMQRLSPYPDIALFWTTLSAIGLATVPMGMYLFALAYTNPSDRRYPGTSMALVMTAMIVAFFYAYSNIVFDPDPTHMKLYPWGYNNNPGPGLAFALVWLNLLMILTIARFINFRRRTPNPILRKQSLVFIFASSVPIVGGTITDGILPLLGIDSLPPSAILMSAVTGILFTYGILRYQITTINPALFSETILAMMHEAVVVVDLKFKIMYVNPEASNLLGVQDSTKHSLSLLDYIPATAKESFHQAFVKAGPHDTVHIDHLDLNHTAGHHTPVRITGSPLQTGGIGVRVLVLADITAELHSKSIIEHKVEVRTKELREARAYLVASINSLEQGFVLIDRDARIVLTNGAAEHLFKHANLAGQTLADAAANVGWAAKLAEAVPRVLANHQPERLSATTVKGSYHTLFITPIVSQHEVLGAAIIIEDVTEERILERSKEEFFSIASHELRTPLTAIRGNMSMLKSYHPKLMQDKSVAGMIEDAHDASLRLIAIVNDFLDSSRLEQGKMEFHIQDLPLGPLVKAVYKELEPSLKTSGNKLVLDQSLAGLPPVAADSDRLHQILFNIIDNAIKHTKDGVITLSAEASGPHALVRVTDTGQGIAPENQKLLFRKFQQAGDSLLTRDSTKGTGLGLYISRLLATNMHGNVALEHSAQGRGSTFLITLPLARTG